MNGKHVYTTLFIIFILFVVQGCKTESPVSPTPTRGLFFSSSTITPAPSATWTPVVLVSPSPTVKGQTSTPTPDSGTQVEQFLKASPYDFRSGSRYFNEARPYAVRGLEYLVYLFPQTIQREVLIESILNNSFQHEFILDLDWLLAMHMRTALLDPLNEAEQVSLDIQKQWNMIETDLDADQEPDYVFQIHFRAKNADTTTPSVFYWLHEVSGVYKLTDIARFFYIFGLEIVSVEDMNNDGTPDLAFQVVTCGASNCFAHPFIYTWQEDHWIEIPVLPHGWTADNGRWHVEKEDGKSVLIALEGNAGGLSYGNVPGYEIRFEYVNGAFIPVDVREYYPTDPNRTGTTESDFYKILWADQLTELGFPQRALEVLLSQENWESNSPSDNYLPYVLFRIGMLNLYLGDVNAAQNVWQRIEIESPDLPVAAPVPELLYLIDQPDPLWKVCHWLKGNEVTWYPADYDPLKHPSTDSFLYHWRWMCSDFALVRWQKWITTRPLEQQAESLGLTWTLLSEDYDLNQDTTPDPIGRLGEWLWVFLSNDTAYAPMLIGPQLPQQALLIYSYDAIGTDRYNEVNIFQDSSDASIWLELIGDYQIAKYEWTGEYFKFHPVKGFGQPDSVFAPPPDPNNLLTQALLALFRDENPARALELLQIYTSDDEWETLTARYITAIALLYNGRASAACPLFEAIIADYPDTGWAMFSREHLQEMGDQ